MVAGGLLIGSLNKKKAIGILALGFLILLIRGYDVSRVAGIEAP